MNSNAAIEIASSARVRFEVSLQFRYFSVEQLIVEVVAGFRPVRDELPPSGPVMDRLAWQVIFIRDPWTVEFTVDDQSGEVLRFRRSRGASQTER